MTETSNAPAGRQGKFEHRKAMILEHAAAVLARKGVSGMTLAEVAARLDLVPTAVSYYFRRKEDLAAACFLQAIGRYNAFIEQAEAAGSNGRERTAAFLRLFLEDLGRRNAEGVDPLVPFNDVRAVGDPTVNIAYVAMFRRLRGLAFPRAEHGLSGMERNARTHLLLSETFWAPVWTADYDALDMPRVVERTVDIILDGMAAPGGRIVDPELPSAELAESSGGYSDAFLKVATQLINEEGYKGASVSKISARLNVTKGSFYHHNAAKDDLVAACFDRTLAMMSRIQHAAERESTGLGRVLAAAGALIRSEASGEAPMLRTSALTSVPEGMRPQLIRRFNQVTLRFASALSDGIVDGSVRPVDTRIAAHTITAAVNAASEIHFWAEGATPAGAFDLYVRPMIQGLYAPPTDPARYS